MKVWLAPLDVVFAPGTVLGPDVFVLPTDAPSGKRVVTTPRLVAEVLSPSTRSFDLVSKRAVYRDAGIGAYLVVDVDKPSISAWTWSAGDETHQQVTGDEVLELATPFPVTITLADLT